MVGIYRKTVKFEEPEKAVAWSDQEAEENAESQNPFGDTLPLSLNVEDEDPVMQVMLKSIQDPELAPIYEGLPDLGLVFVTNCHISQQLILFFKVISFSPSI